jgi:hypothetical protein
MAVRFPAQNRFGLETLPDNFRYLQAMCRVEIENFSFRKGTILNWREEPLTNVFQRLSQVESVSAERKAKFALPMKSCLVLFGIKI